MTSLTFIYDDLGTAHYRRDCNHRGFIFPLQSQRAFRITAPASCPQAQGDCVFCAKCALLTLLLFTTTNVLAQISDRSTSGLSGSDRKAIKTNSASYPKFSGGSIAYTKDSLDMTCNWENRFPENLAKPGGRCKYASRLSRVSRINESDLPGSLGWVPVAESRAGHAFLDPEPAVLIEASSICQM